MREGYHVVLSMTSPKHHYGLVDIEMDGHSSRRCSSGEARIGARRSFDPVAMCSCATLSLRPGRLLFAQLKRRDKKRVPTEYPQACRGCWSRISRHGNVGQRALVDIKREKRRPSTSSSPGVVEGDAHRLHGNLRFRPRVHTCSGRGRSVRCRGKYHLPSEVQPALEKGWSAVVREDRPAGDEIFPSCWSCIVSGA
jgi:hypothetical protein